MTIEYIKPFPGPSLDKVSCQMLDFFEGIAYKELWISYAYLDNDFRPYYFATVVLQDETDLCLCLMKFGKGESNMQYTELKISRIDEAWLKEYPYERT